MEDVNGSTGFRRLIRPSTPSDPAFIISSTGSEVRLPIITGIYVSQRTAPPIVLIDGVIPTVDEMVKLTIPQVTEYLSIATSSAAGGLPDPTTPGWLDSAQFLFPKSVREPFYGDLCEDIAKRAARGHSPARIGWFALSQVAILIGKWILEKLWARH
jgi:hypothetical protein